MEFVKSEIVIFEKATGKMLMMAPATLKPTNPDHDWVALPDDYDVTVCAWDETTRTIKRALNKQQAIVWEKVKQERVKAELGGCASPLGRVDSDVDSQRKISGAVQMAMLAQAAGQPFEMAWTMEDNSVVTHDAPAMIAMGVAVGEHIAACHANALSKRNQIEACVDEAGLAEIDPTTDWP